MSSTTHFLLCYSPGNCHVQTSTSKWTWILVKLIFQPYIYFIYFAFAAFLCMWIKRCWKHEWYIANNAKSYVWLIDYWYAYEGGTSPLYARGELNQIPPIISLQPNTQMQEVPFHLVPQPNTLLSNLFHEVLCTGSHPWPIFLYDALLDCLEVVVFMSEDSPVVPFRSFRTFHMTNITKLSDSFLCFCCKLDILWIELQ